MVKKKKREAPSRVTGNVPPSKATKSAVATSLNVAESKRPVTTRITRSISSNDKKVPSTSLFQDSTPLSKSPAYSNRSIQLSPSKSIEKANINPIKRLTKSRISKIKSPKKPKIKSPTKPQVKSPTKPQVKSPTKPKIKSHTRLRSRSHTRPKIKSPKLQGEIKSTTKLQSEIKSPKKSQNEVKSKSPTRNLSRTSGDMTKAMLLPVKPSNFGTPGLNLKSFQAPNRTAINTPRWQNVRSKITEGQRKDRTDSPKKEVPKIQIEKWKEERKQFMKKRWNFSYLSQMHNFFYHSRTFRKKYKEVLEKRIVEQRGPSVIEVGIKLTNCFRMDSTKIDAVIIIVYETIPKIDEDEIKLVYKSYLFNMSDSPIPHDTDTKWFPIMLYMGQQSYHNAIISWLQTSFNCYVSANGLSMAKFQPLVAAWSKSVCKNENHKEDAEIGLHFKVAIQQESGIKSNKLGNCEMMVPVKSIHNLWDSITGDDDFTIQNLKTFIHYLKASASYLHYIPTSILELYRIDSPCFQLDVRGKIRLHCWHQIRCLLEHLVDSFLKTMNVNVLKDMLKDPLQNKSDSDINIEQDSDDDELE